MVSLVALRQILLWGLILALAGLAWMTSVEATAYDGRVPFGVLACGGAWLGALLALALLRRIDAERWPRLDATRHGLALLVTLLCIAALSHVAPHVSIRVLREEAPPFVRAIYPGASFLVPLWLAWTSRSRSARRQALMIAVAATALTGAPLFLPPPAALGLALVALAMQLDPGLLALPRRLALLGLLLFCAIVIAAGWSGHSPVAARPSMVWLAALAALATAVALRPRQERHWRELVAALAATATLVALCGAAVTSWLAEQIAFEPALRTRLFLFREHPNFLAPFFGSHALLALGLALTASGALRRGLWLAATALLAASTLMTDSKTGLAAMLLGFMAVPALLLLARRARRPEARRALGLGLLAVLVLGVAALVLARGPVQEAIAARMGRFGASKDFRADAWTNSLAIVCQHPWLGIGPHTFVALERFSPGSRFFNAPEAPHPHNVLLYAAQSGGLAALAAALAWIGAMLLGLWRLAVAGGEGGARHATGPPRAGLTVCVLAACLTMLAAGLADVGLSLLSVVPAPLFLVAGLVSAPARRPGEERRGRPAQAFAWSAAVAVVFVPWSLQPLRALGSLAQGRLLSFEAARERNDPALLAKARAAVRTALDRDPWTPGAHELLARWLEATPGGFSPARDLLAELVALAPRDGAASSLLAQLSIRHGLPEEALLQIERALADPQGSPMMNRDRADRVWCLAQLGRREEALDALVDALSLGAGVLAEMRWIEPAAPAFRIAVGGTPRGRPLELIEALENLFARRVADELAGLPVGRAFWMDTYRAFRVAKRDDRAAAVLDWLEAHPSSGVENWTIASERGEIALAAGDPERALHEFERAAAISGNPYFRQRAAEAQRSLSDEAQAMTSTREVLQATGEILDIPTAFHENLLSQAESERLQGRPGASAALLRRTLLFEDEALARARLLTRIGALHREAGEERLALAAHAEAHEILGAKPFPWSSLLEGFSGTLPASLARAMDASWDALGLPPELRQRRAWSLPRYFSHREGPSLFRIELAGRIGRVDLMLREAELRLLDDPSHLPAHWARLFALEALGRHLELAGAMRDLAERYARTGSAHAQFEALVQGMRERLADPQAWWELGVLSLLRGRYGEAVSHFDHARRQIPDDPGREAEVCGWQAMAAFLADRPAEAREALRRANALRPDDPMLRLRLSVIPEAIPTGEGAAAPAGAPGRGEAAR